MHVQAFDNNHSILKGCTHKRSNYKNMMHMAVMNSLLWNNGCNGIEDI